MLNASFAPFPVLKTERLTLRQLVIADEQEILILRSDSDINKYLNRQLSNTIDDARDFISKVNENKSLYWAITVGDDDILVGAICLFGFSDGNNKCEIGYELLTNFQGRGVMKEAAQKVIDYAFNIINVQQIEAFVHADNLNSIKLLEKLSFIRSNEPGNINPGLVLFHLTNSQREFK